MICMAKKKTQPERQEDSKDQYTVRFEPGTREELEQIARQQHRNLNSQIQHIVANYISMIRRKRAAKGTPDEGTSSTGR